MANVYCSSTGSATAPFDTWAKAATTFAAAVGAATVNGDIIAVDATSPPADITANTTWTFAADVSVIASTNSGVGTITPTVMGASAWLGGTGNFSATMNGARRVFLYGITLRVGGTSSFNITINNADGGHFEFEECYLWLGNTNAGARILLGNITASGNNFTRLKNCTFRFGNVAQRVSAGCEVQIEGGSIASAGSAPTGFFGSTNNMTGVTAEGFDFSLVGSGTLVDSMAGSTVTYRLSRCRLHTGAILATQTPANKSSGKVFLFDCSSDDTHGVFGYYDAFGSLISNTSIFRTAGAAQQSWAITTTANCSFATPFLSPWIDAYHTGTSAITPTIEILRDGSATAYNDAQVWGEFSVKTNAGFVNPSFATDRQALVDWAAGTAGANQAAGVGLAEWTGESGTAWSGKVDSGSSVTPAEAGHIRGRVAVGAPSITVYVDPQIVV